MKQLKHVKLFENFEWEADVDGLVDMLHAGLIDGSQYSTAMKDIVRKQGYGLGELMGIEQFVRLEPAIIQDLIADAVTTDEVAAIRSNPNMKLHNVKTGEKYQMVDLYCGGRKTDQLAAEDDNETAAIAEATKLLIERGFRYVYVRTGYHQPYAYIHDTVGKRKANLSLYSVIADIDVKMGIKL